MDELMQTAGRYIGRFWTDISGARDPEEVADVARALVFTPLKAGLKRARDAISSLEVSTSPGGLGHERTANDAGQLERRKVRVARRAPVSGGDVGRASRFAAEAADAAIVEGERKRLLMEHAARLKDFLPKGVLASGEDLDLINTVSSRLGEMSMTGTSRAGTRAAGSKAFAM